MQKKTQMIMQRKLRLFIKNSMDEKQTLFEKLSLSSFKRLRSTALKVQCQVWEHFWKLKAL